MVVVKTADTVKTRVIQRLKTRAIQNFEPWILNMLTLTRIAVGDAIHVLRYVLNLTQTKVSAEMIKHWFARDCVLRRIAGGIQSIKNWNTVPLSWTKPVEDRDTVCLLYRVIM
jgi:hypothetical protein